MAEYKISEEVAQEQFSIFINYYEIELDEDLQSMQKIIIKAIRNGRLEIKEEDGLKVTQLLKNGDKLEYSEISGEDKIEMNKHDKQGQYARMYALVGKLTKQGHITITKLKGTDSSLVEALAVLFLAV